MYEKKRVVSVNLDSDAAATVDKIRHMPVDADTDEKAILWLLRNVKWTNSGGGGAGGGGAKQERPSEERYARDLKPGTIDMTRKPEMGIAVPEPEQPEAAP